MKKELILWLISELFSENKETSDEVKNILGSENIGKYVIIRWYDSWVHFGKLELASPWLYRLSDSRRLYRWWAKEGISLSWVATYWLAVREEVKICAVIPMIEITDNRISEIIPCTSESIKSIREYPEFKPN